MLKYHHRDALHRQRNIPNWKPSHFTNNSKQSQTNPEAFQIFLQKNICIRHSTHTIGWRQMSIAYYLNLPYNDQCSFRKDHKGKGPGKLFKKKLKLSDKVKVPFTISEVSKKEFTNGTSRIQIYNCLDLEKLHQILNVLMLEGRGKRSEEKHRFQGIGMIILQMTTGRSDFFLGQVQPQQKSMSMEQTRQTIEDIGHRYQHYIKRADIAERINSASHKHGVNFQRLLNRIFKDDCKDLTWKEVIFLLIQRNCSSSQSILDVQRILACESKSTKRLLCNANIVEWDKDKGQYFVVRQVLYLKLLDRHYSGRNQSFNSRLKQLIIDMSPQAYQKAIQAQEQKNLTESDDKGERKDNIIDSEEDEGESQDDSECNNQGIQSQKIQQGTLFLYNYFKATRMQLLSQKPQSLTYQIDRENQSFVIKLFLSQQELDIHLESSIFEKRISYQNGRDRAQICKRFNHPGRLVLISPVFQLQKIKKQIHFPRFADKNRILLAFFKKIYTGDRCFLYTLDNTGFLSNQIHFHKSSIVGLMPLIKKSDFRKEVLEQVFELFDLSLFDETEDRLSLIGSNQKFRAIAMLLLYLISGQKVSLLEKDDFIGEELLSFWKTRKLVGKIPERFRKYLQKPGNLERIQRAERRNGVKYLAYLRQIFEDNCRTMNWVCAANLLFHQDALRDEKINLIEQIDGEDNRIRTVR